jgi:hypothetical protein
METYERLHAQLTDRGPWMQTYTGRAFFLQAPSPADVHIVDIAHSLGHTCRYSGHTLRHYSVAQHGVLVSRWMEDDGHPPSWCFAGLHHDSPEAYIGDQTSQVKQLIPEFRALDRQIEEVIDARFGINRTDTMRKVIKEYDFIALATEKRDMMGENQSECVWGDLPEPHPARIIPKTCDRAVEMFLRRHTELVYHMAAEAYGVREEAL